MPAITQDTPPTLLDLAIVLRAALQETPDESPFPAKAISRPFQLLLQQPDWHRLLGKRPYLHGLGLGALPAIWDPAWNALRGSSPPLVMDREIIGEGLREVDLIIELETLDRDRWDLFHDVVKNDFAARLEYRADESESFPLLRRAAVSQSPQFRREVADEREQAALRNLLRAVERWPAFRSSIKAWVRRLDGIPGVFLTKHGRLVLADIAQDLNALTELVELARDALAEQPKRQHRSSAQSSATLSRGHSGLAGLLRALRAFDLASWVPSDDGPNKERGQEAPVWGFRADACRGTQ